MIVLNLFLQLCKIVVLVNILDTICDILVKDKECPKDLLSGYKEMSLQYNSMKLEDIIL
jgi:hypothetical protein